MSEAAEVLEPTAKPFEVFSEKPLPAGMGETVTLPVSPSRRNLLPPITKANASEYGKRGAAARTRNKLAKAQQPNALALTRADMLAKQITRTCDVLSDDTKPLEPKERAQLLTALDRLMERERVLRGIPGPGNFRPSKSSNRQPSTGSPTFEE